MSQTVRCSHNLGAFNSLPGETDSWRDSVSASCRQSKSTVLGIWEPGELVNSNNNLLEVDFKREDGEYVVRERGHVITVINPFYFQLPEGGIEAGLCGRMVLL